MKRIASIVRFSCGTHKRHRHIKKYKIETRIFLTPPFFVIVSGEKQKRFA
jgi:hypothetical protein